MRGRVLVLSYPELDIYCAHLGQLRKLPTSFEIEIESQI